MQNEDLPKGMPFTFVLDDLASLDPVVGRMFGCFSIYVGQKIMLILRDGRQPEADNGIWIATTAEHHQSLLKDLPSMRSIEVFGPGPTGWQVLPVESDEFERDSETVCRLILQGDPRIGKIPAKKKLKAKLKPKKVSKTKSPKAKTL